MFNSQPHKLEVVAPACDLTLGKWKQEGQELSYSQLPNELKASPNHLRPYPYVYVYLYNIFVNWIEFYIVLAKRLQGMTES